MVDPVDDIVFRLCISGTVINSVIMGIVDSVKEVDVGALNERLGFVEQEMQKLEGCLRLKQEALDEDIFDLMVSRDVVWQRLEEAEYLILNRGSELSAAMERESVLRDAVEIKDREINSMKVLLEMSNKIKNARYSDQSRHNRARGEGDDGDLDHLKEEIGRQLVNIRRNLESGRVCLTEGMREICRSRLGQSEDCSSLASEAASECTMPTDEVDGFFFPYVSLNTRITESYGNSVEVTGLRDRPDDVHRPSWLDLQKMFFQLSGTNMAFNQMMDILQRTLDVLFLKMKQNISTYKTSLSEKCWEHELVSGILRTVLQSFMEGLQGDSGARTAEKVLNEQVVSSNERCFNVKEANTCLGNGFECSLCASDENMRKDLQKKKRDFEGGSSLADEDHHNISPITGINSPYTSLENRWLGSLVHPPKVYLEHHNNVSSVTGMNSSCTSLENGCRGTLVCPPREESFGQATHSVAKMIMNHESLIRRKMKEISMEETHWYKGEISRREYSPLRMETSSDAKRKRVLGIASSFDNNITENIVTSTGQTIDSGSCKIDLLFRLNFPSNEKLDSLDDVLDCSSSEVNMQDIAELNYEVEDVAIQAVMTKEVFAVLLLKCVEEVNLQLHDQAILSFMKDDILGLVVKDILLNWDEEKDLDINRKVEVGIKKNTESCLCKINYLRDSKREKILPQATILKTLATEGVYQPSPVFDTISRRSFCSSGTDSGNKKEQQQEKEDGEFQTMVMKEVLLLLYRESVKELGFHLEHGSILTLLIEDVLRLIVRWTLTDWDCLDSCGCGTIGSNDFLRKRDCRRDASSQSIPCKVFGVQFRQYAIQLFIQLEEHVILGLMMEDVLKFALREMLIEWNREKDFCIFGSLVTGDVHLTILSEAIKSVGCIVDGGLSIFGTDSKCKSIIKYLPFSDCHAADVHVGNDEIHKKVRDPLFNFIKRNHRMINDCRNTMEHWTDFGLGSQELKELNKQETQSRDILDEQGSILGKHNERLQWALKPPLCNGARMRKFKYFDVILRDYEQVVIAETITACMKWVPFPFVDNEEKGKNSQETVDVCTMDLSEMFLDLEHVVHEKLSIFSSRDKGKLKTLSSISTRQEQWLGIEKAEDQLIQVEMMDWEGLWHSAAILHLSRTLEVLNEQLHPLSQRASTLRNKEFVYRVAFKRRCCNLQKAEIEVDLLADEVDMLLRLIEKVYVALDYYSPVLQHYAGVMDIMNLIRRELAKEFTLL